MLACLHACPRTPQDSLECCFNSLFEESDARTHTRTHTRHCLSLGSCRSQKWLQGQDISLFLQEYKLLSDDLVHVLQSNDSVKVKFKKLGSGQKNTCRHNFLIHLFRILLPRLFWFAAFLAAFLQHPLRSSHRLFMMICLQSIPPWKRA